jgi:multicomponent Na+:H+ antiporter subunit A
MLLAVLAGFVLALVAPTLRVRVGRSASWIVAAGVLAIFAYYASWLGPVVGGAPAVQRHDWVPGLQVALSFRLDGLNLLFALLVSGIGTLIMAYAGGYMGEDRDTGRLLALLVAFMASMLGVVTSDNLLALFVFWELTSLTSYLLIGFKHEKEKSRKAALQALLVTGAGGLALLPGLLMLGHAGGSFEVGDLLTRGDQVRAHALYPAIVVCVLAGAFTKSAQFPFHFWLPNAMEAPTPISAYLHSATMVKAGVFLLARLSPVLGGTPLWAESLTIAGTVTMVVGGFLAAQQTDLKRLLAYTTVGALGALTLLIGLGSTEGMIAAVLLVLAHALYKGALFMVAGSIDHETGTRDILHLRGLWSVMPVTTAAAGLAALSAAGLPPLFGFISKEAGYAALDHSAPIVAAAVVANAFGLLVAGLVGWQAFYGERADTPKHPHEAPVAMWIGPLTLGLLGLGLGLVPALADGLVSAAAGAMWGQPVGGHLALWHGFEGEAGVVLLLSAATVLLGLAFYLAHRRFVAWSAHLAHPYSYGPEGWYHASLSAMLRVAAWQTRLLQNGYLRYYILTVVGTTIVLAGWVLATRVPVPPLDTGDVRPYELVILAMMVASTLLVLRTDSRLTAIVALGVVGYGVALLFLLYGAPDLALTQFAIETLSVVLFVLVLYRLPRFVSMSRPVSRVRDAFVAVGLGVLMTALILVTTPQPLLSPLAAFFAEASLPQAFGRNVVNVILVDFRGLDTMGEITVLSVAALGVYALLKLRPRED